MRDFASKPPKKKKKKKEKQELFVQKDFLAY